MLRPMSMRVVAALAACGVAASACAETAVAPAAAPEQAATCAAGFEAEAATHDRAARFVVGELAEGLLCRYAPAESEGLFALHSQQQMGAETLASVKEALLAAVPFDPRAADCNEATAVALVLHLFESNGLAHRVTAGGHGDGLGCATLHGQGRQFESYPVWKALHDQGLMAERLYVPLRPEPVTPPESTVKADGEANCSAGWVDYNADYSADTSGSATPRQAVENWLSQEGAYIDASSVEEEADGLRYANAEGRTVAEFHAASQRAALGCSAAPLFVPTTSSATDRG